MSSQDSILREDRPIRVFYVEANEDGSVGGSHQVLFDMVGALDRKRYSPAVIFHQDNRFAAAFRSLGVPVVTWDEVREKERAIQDSGRRIPKALGWLHAIKRRRALLEEMQIDLLHMNNSPRSGRTDWLPAARLARIPVVASARGDAKALPGTGLRPAIHRWLVTKFDKVIPVSEYIAEAWRAQGVPADKVTVVHDGVNPATVQSLGRRSREEVRQDLSVPSGRLLVAMVGNVRRWKGQHVVIEALSLLEPAVRAELFVAFIGAVRKDDQDYFDTLQKSVAEYGLGDTVAFYGIRTDVPDILAVSDIAVHSSVTPEPGGTVVIEAMSFGAPVICASKGGHLDYLQPGIGMTHDVDHPSQLAAHLTTLARNPELRAQMANGARVRAREFSIERTARKMEAVYDEVLRERK